MSCNHSDTEKLNSGSTMDDIAEICVARHGETDWNVQGILQGWLDVPINAAGRQQAIELADTVVSNGFAAVWASPLVRARESAEIIAERLNLPPPKCHEGLKERHFGAIQGIPKVELADLNPVLLQQILKRNPATHFEDGETMNEFADRVLASVIEIGKLHAGQRVLVITHGWVLDVFNRHINKLPRSTILNLKPKNGETLWLKANGESVMQH